MSEGACGQTTVSLLLERLADKGPLKNALVLIKDFTCNMETAQAILDAGADTLLVVKANQSGLMGEMARFVDDPSQQGVAADTPTDKGHGRIKEREASVSTRVDRLAGERHVPCEHRCHGLAMIAKGGSRTWEQDNETRGMDS